MSVIERMVTIGSLLLLISTLLMGAVRQEQSTAYWLLTESSPDGPQFYGYYLVSPNGKLVRKIGSASAATNGTWFVSWLPEQDVLFYRVISQWDAEKKGLYRLDLRSDQTKLLFEKDFAQSDLSVVPSPDKKWLLLTSSSVEGQSTYLVSSDGSEARSIDLKASIQSFIGWSKDSKALTFGITPDDINSRIMRYVLVDTNGTILEENINVSDQFIIHSPHDKSFLYTKDGNFGTWMVQNEDGSQIQLTQGQDRYAVVAWFESNWIILSQRTPILATDPQAGNFERYYRVRPNGTGMTEIFGIQLAHNDFTLPFWTSNGDAFYITKMGRLDDVEVIRIEIENAKHQTIFADFEFASFYGRSAEERRNPTGFLWTRDDQWFVWQKDAQTPTIKFFQTRTDGSETRLLWSATRRLNNLQIWDDPTGNTLLFNYAISRSNRVPVYFEIMRVNLENRSTELINPNLSMRLIALSPVVDKPFSELQLISSAMGGLLLIALHRRQSTQNH